MNIFAANNFEHVIILAEKPKYRIINDTPNRLLEFYWLNHEQPMTCEDFKEGSQTLTRFILKERPNGLIISYIDMNYVISYEMQQWFVKEEAASWLNSSLKKVALIVNHNLLIQHSLDAIMDESMETYKTFITNRYFNSFEDAKKWILNA
ncbi:MAG: hypothetical protein N2167_08625 [Flavobacteriales bacterium]|nr:hypothetical protein [Flavobacteriales bacterium]